MLHSSLFHVKEYQYSGNQERKKNLKKYRIFDYLAVWSNSNFKLIFNQLRIVDREDPVNK